MQAELLRRGNLIELEPALKVKFKGIIVVENEKKVEFKRFVH